MLSVAAGATNTKVRPSTGVATTNSTNKNPNANKLSWAINYFYIGHVQGEKVSAQFFVFSPPKMTVFSNHLRAYGNFPDLGFILAEP